MSTEEPKVTKIYLSTEEVLENFLDAIKEETPDIAPVLMLGRRKNGYVIHSMDMDRPTIAFAQKTLEMFFNEKWFGE